MKLQPGSHTGAEPPLAAGVLHQATRRLRCTVAAAAAPPGRQAAGSGRGGRGGGRRGGGRFDRDSGGGGDSGEGRGRQSRASRGRGERGGSDGRGRGRGRGRGEPGRSAPRGGRRTPFPAAAFDAAGGDASDDPFEFNVEALDTGEAAAQQDPLPPLTINLDDLEEADELLVPAAAAQRLAAPSFDDPPLQVAPEDVGHFPGGRGKGQEHQQLSPAWAAPVLGPQPQSPAGRLFGGEGTPALGRVCCLGQTITIWSARGSFLI
jgi:hypothetical protein